MQRQLVLLLAVTVYALATPVVENNDRQGKIVGSGTVPISQVPFMASLRSFVGNVHFCGGSILTSRWVLSAAQCTAGREVNSINVVVGTATLNAGGVTYRSGNIIQHPLFDPHTLAFDVSLVYTATVIAMTTNIQTIALSSNIIVGGVSAQVSGWGFQSGGATPNNLHRLQTQTLTNADCGSRHSMQNSQRVTDNKICSFTRPAEGTCYGDEGGALVVENELIGIASWQVPCAVGHPDVFERITASRLWILSQIG